MNENAGAEHSQVEAQLTQESYKESPYQDSAWEIVGEIVKTEDFKPMSVAVLPTSAQMTDPMFANFGGLSAESSSERWHLPQHLSARDGRQVEDVAPGTITITEAELERIRSEAREQAKLEAFEEAATKNAENIGIMRDRIKTVLQDILKQQQETLVLIERMGVELALEVAHKIIGTAVEINPEYIVEVVRAAVSQSGTATIKRIRVSPQDMEFINVVGLPRDVKEQGSNWKFEADDTVRSGCVVETSAGEIDFQLDKAWERVKDQVVKVLR